MGENGVVVISGTTGGLAAGQGVQLGTGACSSRPASHTSLYSSQALELWLLPTAPRSAVPLWKSGFFLLKLVVWEGFVCSDLALRGGGRLCWKLLYGEGTEISRATSPVPWAQMAFGQQEPTSCSW